MRPVQRLLMASLAVVVVVLLQGCASTDGKGDPSPYNYVAIDGPVGDLYRLCFESAQEPEDCTFDVFLYLDHINLPNPRYSYPYLRLMNTYEFGGGIWASVSFDYYEYNNIPADSGFPATPVPGWKVKISGARVSVCTGCYTDGGNLDIISLFGDRSAVEFVWDPVDTLAAYVRAVPVDEAQ